MATVRNRSNAIYLATGLKVGSPLKYTLETKNWYVKLKEYKENNFRGNPGFANPSTAVTALNNAVRLVSASIAADGRFKELSEKTPQIVIKLSDHFHQ